MTVEELIAELQKMPPTYEVKAFYEGVEVEDFEADITFVERQPTYKQVDMVIGKLPDCIFCTGYGRAINELSRLVELPGNNTDCSLIAEEIKQMQREIARMEIGATD